MFSIVCGFNILQIAGPLDVFRHNTFWLFFLGNMSFAESGVIRQIATNVLEGGWL